MSSDTGIDNYKCSRHSAFGQTKLLAAIKFTTFGWTDQIIPKMTVLVIPSLQSNYVL